MPAGSCCRLADQDPEQIAHLMLLGQGVGQRQLGLDLVAVPSALPLAHHVALVHQLGDDPVGGALGDPDGGGDVPQPDAGVTSNADQDVRVVGQKVSAGRGLLRVLACHIGRVFHEIIVLCSLDTENTPIPPASPMPAGSPIPSASLIPPPSTVPAGSPRLEE
jgi:hypothetical protein